MPLVLPVRPFIRSSPFSCELVLDRVSWDVLATKYLLLPVHVSLSFIQTPTLSSALYLLLLRFLARDYNDVQRLVSSVSTDTELTIEEECIFSAISQVRDGHPNAHAARLHVSLALIDAPEAVKGLVAWDIPNELYKYLNKLTYVAMSSRLDRESEQNIVEIAIDQIRKEDVIRSVLSAFPKPVLEKFIAFLTDPNGTLCALFLSHRRATSSCHYLRLCRVSPVSILLRMFLQVVVL